MWENNLLFLINFGQTLCCQLAYHASLLSSAFSVFRPPSNTHPPDPTLAAELGRFHRVLGPTGVTELALHAAIANIIPAIDIIPEKYDKGDKAASLVYVTSMSTDHLYSHDSKSCTLNQNATIMLKPHIFKTVETGAELSTVLHHHLFFQQYCCFKSKDFIYSAVLGLLCSIFHLITQQMF